MPKPTLYLIDAHAYIHRAYHAIPPLSSPSGVMVNAVFGFIRLILKIIREKKPSHIAVCFDHPAETIRKKQYPLYKATRKPIDEDLKVQIPLARKAVDLLGLTVVEMAGYEADDLIATLSIRGSEQRMKVIIVSGDKDILQLVGNDVVVWNVQKDIMIDSSSVESLKGVKPDQIIDMFALMGDSSDNVPGVPGIGAKTAVTLIKQFSSLENLYKNVHELSGKVKDKLVTHKDQAYISKDLVTLKSDVPIEISLSDIPGNIDNVSEQLVAYFRELGFDRIIKELTEKKVSAVSVEKNYSVITNESELAVFIESVKKTRTFALDVETTGLDIFTSSIIGISLSVESNRAYYLPVNTASAGLFAALKEFLEHPDNKIIGHNLKFDFLMLEHAGIHLACLYFDTMLASYLLNPSRNNQRLKSLALEYLSFQMTEYEELVGKGKNAVPLEGIPVEKLKEYACADADATYMLYMIMKEQLAGKNLQKLFFDVEMPLLIHLARMKQTGIKLDRQFLQSLDDDFTKRLDRLMSDIYNAAGQEFNIQSPKQIAAVLFEKLKLPVVRRTKTGFSTDDEVLEELSHHHVLPRLLREYREIQKLKSTYIDGMIEGMDPATSRIHASFNQAVTATGRLSSSNPNLQNIPIRTENGRLIRRVFIPEDGYVFLSADYSQIDLRVLAHLSQDPVLVSAFKAGGDIHKATASEIYKLPVEDISDEMRSRAKAINFGIVYGQQSFGLAQSLGISKSDAKDFIEDYFKKYAGVKQWIDNTLEHVRETGMVSTMLGRIRYLPEMRSGQPRMRAFGERMAMNTPIQGSAADIIKVAMVNIAREIMNRGLRSRMLVQVHDDLLLEVPENELDVMKRILKEKMEHALELSVPLIVELKTGKNWRDMKKI